MAENSIRLTGSLDRRGMFGFWGRRFCRIQNNFFEIFKNEEMTNLEDKFLIDDNVQIGQLDDLRFSLTFPDNSVVQFRAICGDILNSWIFTLHSINFTQNSNSISINSFQLLKIVGRGYYGKVTLARKIDTGKVYAIKSIHKKKVMSSNRTSSILVERNILKKSNNPFIVRLDFAFQTSAKFYLITEFAPGGDLMDLISKKNYLFDEEIRFYCAEIAAALHYLHDVSKAIHRDLKSENILIFEDGHIKVTDFGLAKYTHNNTDNSFCGTAEFLSPEVVKHEKYSCKVDWWALGIILYEMAFGITPFFHDNQMKMMKRIVENDPPFHGGRISDDLKQLICGLLDKNPEKRFGYNETINSNFMKSVNFEDVIQKKLVPPFIPNKLNTSENILNTQSLIGNSKMCDLNMMNFDDGAKEPIVDSIAPDVQGSLEQITNFSFNRDVISNSSLTADGIMAPADFVDCANENFMLEAY